MKPKKASNYFIRAYDLSTNDTYAFIRVNTSEDLIDHLIQNIYNDDKKLIEVYNQDPNELIYYRDIKEYLMRDYPQIYESIDNLVDRYIEDNQYINIYDGDWGIMFDTESHYRHFNSEYDNECILVESVMRDIEREDKHKKITKEMLLDKGFAYIYDGYPYLHLWVDDNMYKITMGYKETNNGADWNLHLDDDDCCTIGSADIDTVWQFNTFMKIFDIEFKL